MRPVLKPTLVLSLALSSLAGISVTAVADEDESYRLEQMRKMSQGDNNKPSVEVLGQQSEESDLLADTDMQKLSKPDADFSSVSDIKPKFEKPKLDLVKPQL